MPGGSPTPTSILYYAPGQPPTTFTNTTSRTPRPRSSEFPAATVATATAAAAAAGITDPGLQQSAVLDYLETSDPSYLTSANNLQQFGITSTIPTPS